MRKTTWGRNRRCPLTCVGAPAAVAQGITAPAPVTGPSPLPEVTPWRSRGSGTDASRCLCGSCGGWCNGAHPSSPPPGKQRQMEQGRCWHTTLSVPLLGGRDREHGWRAGGTGIRSSRGEICQSSSFRTPRHASQLTYTFLMTVAPLCLH